MSELMRLDGEYRNWIEELVERYRKSQIKASIHVNSEMLMYYWSIGKDIKEKHAESKWGCKFFKNMSMDMATIIPHAKGFSPTNLRYMMRFYELFQTIEIVPQLGEQLAMTSNKVFMIPWGHIKLLIDKCHDNPERLNFYIDKIIENNWSRAVLANWLDTNLYERQGKAITNFAVQLSEVQGDLANELTKDPYNFDFLSMTEGYNEKELKDALTDNIVKFLMELGNGFAFVGREYMLEVGKTEQFIDLLFYNIRLHCYVVIEVKMEKFKPADIGQLGTYVVAVHHVLKTDEDNPTLGLLICKEKDEILAQYAVESSGEPVGISEFELSKVYPTDFKNSMPTIEELEKAL